MSSAEAHADRLLRFYPAAWRERYGEEFADLLVSEIEEEPQSLRRTADVVRGGLVARCSLAGLGAGPIAEPNLALAAAGAVIVSFAALGVSLWSQLMTGAHLAPLDTRAASTGAVVLTVALGYLGVLALLATIPVAAMIFRAFFDGSGRRLMMPSAVLVGGLGALAAGGHHMGQHWTAIAGTGSSSLPVPDSAASFGWGETFSISTYWAHPSVLLAMPLTRLGWLVLSPVALVSVLAAAAVLLRRVELSAAVLRYELRLVRAAVIGMVPMLGAATWWVLASQHDPNAHLRAGSLDLLLIAAMAVAIVLTPRRFVKPIP